MKFQLMQRTKGEEKRKSFGEKVTCYKGKSEKSEDKMETQILVNKAG